MQADIIIDSIAITFLAILTLYLIAVAINFQRRIVLTKESHDAHMDLLRSEIGLITDRRRVEKEKITRAWNGFRKFQISKKTEEAKGVCSFYLTPHDRKELAPFEPGQFLTFGLKIPEEPKIVTRCYSLSDNPYRTDYYRVTIKRVPPPRDVPDAPAGKSSNFFHDSLNEGDILDIQAPSGHFYLNTLSRSPVVLIGGGVGITPVLSMLNSIIESSSKRETHFFYGIVNGVDHAFKEHLRRIDQENENIHMHICYSNPEERDIKGQDYQHEGRVSIDLFKQTLNSNNFDFYICGPPPMMDSLVGGLNEWGVPKEHVHFESFGPASVKRTKPATSVSESNEHKILFSRSGKKITWDAAASSILEFAEDQGITNIDSGCRAGNCGSCIVAIKEGSVDYVSPPGNASDDGSCHTCITVPTSDLVLDA